METMVERVARALCAADGELPEAFHTRAALEPQDRDGAMLTDAAVPLWLSYRKAARAAIEAMREPIYEARAVFGKLDLAKLHSEDPYLHSIVRHAMDSLDAALADPEKESA